MKADPDSANSNRQRLNCYLLPVVSMPFSRLALFSVDCDKRCSVNGGQCTGCDVNHPESRVAFHKRPGCSKVHGWKDNPVNINIHINRRWQCFPFLARFTDGLGSVSCFCSLLIFSADNSSLFISFPPRWAMLRAAVGKEETRLSPSLLQVLVKQCLQRIHLGSGLCSEPMK